MMWNSPSYLGTKFVQVVLSVLFELSIFIAASGPLKKDSSFTLKTSSFHMRQS